MHLFPSDCNAGQEVHLRTSVLSPIRSPNYNISVTLTNRESSGQRHPAQFHALRAYAVTGITDMLQPTLIKSFPTQENVMDEKKLAVASGHTVSCGTRGESDKGCANQMQYD